MHERNFYHIVKVNPTLLHRQIAWSWGACNGFLLDSWPQCNV